MRARPFLLAGALAAVGCLSGCDTLSGVTGWIPGLGHPQFEMAQDATSLEIHVHGATLEDAKIDQDANAVALTLNGTADAKEFAQIQKDAAQWIAGTHTDGDTATLVAREPVKIAASPDGDGFVVSFQKREVAATAAAPDSEDAPVGEPLDGIQREDLGTAFGVAETPPSGDASIHGSL
jgi:hypothetical protein